MPGIHRRTLILGAASFSVVAALGGARAADFNREQYEVTTFAIVAAAGKPAAAKVTLRAKSPFVINPLYPFKLRFAPPSGLSMPKTLIRTEDASRRTSQEIELPVAYTAAAPGTYALTGDFSLSVSNPDGSNAVMDKLTLTLELVVR